MDAQGLASASVHRKGHEILLSRFEPGEATVFRTIAVERFAVRREPRELP
jgi:hypothetical protein